MGDVAKTGVLLAQFQKNSGSSEASPKLPRLSRQHRPILEPLLAAMDQAPTKALPSGDFLMFMRRFRKFTKRLNCLVKRMGGVAGFAIVSLNH